MSRQNTPPPRILIFSLLGSILLLSPAGAALQISEFMAVNESTLADEDGDFSDWIEIYNPDGSPASLAGYSLTDDSLNLVKWTFPAITLNAGESLVVFASSKDRIDPASELHTNFRLSSGGEYLALVEPGGLVVISQFAPSYPQQFADESFGFGDPGGSSVIDITPAWSSPANYATVQINGAGSANLGPSPDSLDAFFNGSQLQYYMWFDFSSRLELLPPSAVINSATLTWSGNVSGSVFGPTAATSQLGIFPVPDDNKGIDTVASNYNTQLLPDYFSNNSPVSTYTAVPGQSPATSWDIKSLIEEWQANPTAAQRGQMMIINSTQPMYMDWDVDAAGKPTLQATVTTSINPGTEPPLVYFDTPTPGTTNSEGQQAGPLITEVTENPPPPGPGPLTITTRIAGSLNPVANVTLYYRRDFNPESPIPMNDDGISPDFLAGDNVYTANIPASAIAPGQMTRWRVVASDTTGAQSKTPHFRDPMDSHEYFGTVGLDPSIVSNLNVLQWFVENPSSADTVTGTRGSVSYLGEFYDNVHFNRHGQSTGGFVKKSYNLDFNKTQRFLWSNDAPRVADIDLLTNWADKSKVRHPLAWEIMRESGVNAHYAFTIRVEQNGEFFSTADFVEDGDDIFLERAGLNKDGALYKVYSNRLNKDQGDTGYAGIEKKNRKSENNDDLQALIDGLDLLGTGLDEYIRDNIDIPKTVNMLAANSVVRNIDMHSKNWYIYRDSGKTNEWAILPWDLDLSQGRVWNTTNTYFDNQVYTDGLVVTGNSIRLVSHLFNNTETRAMIMRRIRSLSDQFLQPESTPLAERWYERRLDEQAALIDDPLMLKSDAQLDFEKWGSWTQGSGAQVPFTSTHPDVESMAEAIVRWKTEYLPGRRNEIYNNQTIGNGGEIPEPQFGISTTVQTSLVLAGDSAFSFVPPNGNLGLTWTGSIVNEPFDTSGWISGTTGIGYERTSGYESLIGTNVNTEMMSNNSIYIRIPFNVDDPAAFESLELRMQWDDGFVAFLNGDLLTAKNNPAQISWNSAALNASHEANAAIFDVYDVSNKLTSLRAGPNILAIQGLNQGTGSSDFIIRPELYASITTSGAPSEPRLLFGTIEFSPPSGNQDEEFVEITNPFAIAVDISGWQVTGGIEHVFAPGTVIPPSGTLYLSPDVNTFRARPASPTGGEGLFIQGSFKGHLSSFSETLNLMDSKGNLLTTATYTGNPTDPQLYLVISEVMYHPSGDGLAEYIELINVSPTVTLDLTGVHFVEGIEFDFTGSAITSLAPGQRVLIVADLAAFTAVHGPGLPIAGVFANASRLNNGGETIKLEDSLNGTIREFRYNDKTPWPTDGQAGYSILLRNPFSVPDPALPENWRASSLPGGNPGSTDTIPLPVNPLGDDNGNTIPDLVDYALGNNPGTSPITASTSWQDYLINGIIERRFTMSYPVSIGADGVTLGIEASTDLKTWFDASSLSEEVSRINQGDGRAIVTTRFNTPIGTGPVQFLRIKIEQ